MTTEEQFAAHACIPARPMCLLSGFAAESITQAIHECQRSDRATAAAAIRWLRARTDWTRIPLERRLARWGSPAPPENVRLEFVGTFEWCCMILGIDVEDTRAHGLPYRQEDFRFYLWRGGLANWREWRETRKQKRPPTRLAVQADRPEEIVCV